MIEARHITKTFGRLRVLDDMSLSIEPRRIVDRNRNRDFGRRHNVNRGLVALEDLEDSAQKSMREQHSRSSHLDENDICFAGNCAHWPVRSVESNPRSLSLGLAGKSPIAIVSDH